MNESGILTYKDRESLRRRIRESNSDSSISNEKLILHLSSVLQNQGVESEEEKIFQEYTFDLINVLRTADNKEASEIAQAVLNFIATNFQADAEERWKLPAKQRVYITSVAIKEISEIINLPKANEIHGLTVKERAEAEKLLLRFASVSDSVDLKNRNHAKNFIELYDREKQSRLMTRYLKNIKLLVRALESGDLNTEDRAWARGALSYIRLNRDVIPDEYGLIGVLDDMYIANLAVGLIRPSAPPLTELVLEFRKIWPILNGLIFSEDKSEYRYTDIASINSALVCMPLRGENQLRTALVLPFSGCTPNIIAIAAVFGAISVLAKKVKDGPDFKIGDLVRVDNTAVATYGGIYVFEGKEYIRLNQVTKKASEKQPEQTVTNLIPLQDSARLCPAKAGSKTQGEIQTYLKSTERELSAIENLLHLPHPLQFHSIDSHIWLISSADRMRSLAKDLRVHGQRLIDVFPMGHIKRDGTCEAWSARFGESECVLITVTDLDLAAEILEETEGTDRDLVIADLSGPNRNRISSLERVFDLDLNVLCIAEERDEGLISIVEQYNPDIWEWSGEEVSEIGKFPQSQSDSTHPFYKNDGRLIRAISGNTSTRAVQLESLEWCHATISAATKKVPLETEDKTLEFHEIYRKLFSIFLRLTRMPFQVDPEWFGNDEKVLSTLKEQLVSSVFMTEEEKKSLTDISMLIHKAGQALVNANPKWTEMYEILKSNPKAKVLIHNPAVIPDELQSEKKYILMKEACSTACEILIVPYWPGKDKSWKLLTEADVKEIVFLLYPYEADWYKSFVRHRELSRRSRTERRNSQAIFPKVGTWPKKTVMEKLSDNLSQTPHELDLVELNNSYRRTRIIKSIESMEKDVSVETRLVGFSGGGHAFLSSGYEARLATYLLESEAHANTENITISSAVLDNLNIGDVLIFLKGSDKDAIRKIADENLPEGMRNLAKLWQTALKGYVEKEKVSLEELVSLLSQQGCRKHRATVKNWLESENIIGPRNAHRGDLEAIVNVTNDSTLSTNLPQCQNAITEVWGQHLKAAKLLAKNLLEKISSNTKFDIDIEEPVEVIDGILLAKIEFIESETVHIPRSKINRLLEEL